MTKQSIVVFILLIYVLIRSLFIEPNSLAITEYRVESTALEGVRIAFLSDLHLRRRDYKKVDKIVNLVKSKSPDLILLGGDYAVGHDIKNSIDMNYFAEKIASTGIQTFAVLGEYDNYSGADNITYSLRKYGIRVLENSAQQAIVKRRYIYIIGLADLMTKDVNIDKAFLNTKDPRIVLSHNPDTYYDILDNVDLILAGHTHGGQFILPFSPPLYTPSKLGATFASGLLRPLKNQMIISKGLGQSTVPFRFNCKPEIIIVDFVKKGMPHSKAKRML